MRRADRLFQIVQYLRAGRLLTAKILADRLEVSERTIYRDIADLQSSGVPIEGEAGIGYLMRGGYDLPPLMFTKSEVEALIIGARMIAAWGGAKMALDAETSIAKIDAVLPDNMKGFANRTQVFAFDRSLLPDFRERFDLISNAIQDRSVLSIVYADTAATISEREIEPLGLYFWGSTWTVAAWCRLRTSFRSFRIDRIQSSLATGEKTKAAKGKTLRDYLLQSATVEGQEPPKTLF